MPDLVDFTPPQQGMTPSSPFPGFLDTRCRAGLAALSAVAEWHALLIAERRSTGATDIRPIFGYWVVNVAAVVHFGQSGLLSQALGVYDNVLHVGSQVLSLPDPLHHDAAWTGNAASRQCRIWTNLFRSSHWAAYCRMRRQGTLPTAQELTQEHMPGYSTVLINEITPRSSVGQVNHADIETGVTRVHQFPPFAINPNTAHQQLRSWQLSTGEFSSRAGAGMIQHLATGLYYVCPQLIRELANDIPAGFFTLDAMEEADPRVPDNMQSRLLGAHTTPSTVWCIMLACRNRSLLEANTDLPPLEPPVLSTMDGNLNPVSITTVLPSTGAPVLLAPLTPALPLPLTTPTSSLSRSQRFSTAWGRPLQQYLRGELQHFIDQGISYPAPLPTVDTGNTSCGVPLALGPQ